MKLKYIILIIIIFLSLENNSQSIKLDTLNFRGNNEKEFKLFSKDSKLYYLDELNSHSLFITRNFQEISEIEDNQYIHLFSDNFNSFYASNQLKFNSTDNIYNSTLNHNFFSFIDESEKEFLNMGANYLTIGRKGKSVKFKLDNEIDVDFFTQSYIVNVRPISGTLSLLKDLRYENCFALLLSPSDDPYAPP